MVYHRGCSSDVFPINAGVPQGSVLSPTLLLLYINELLEITSNPVYSFADDSTLVSCMEPGKPLPSQETACLRHHHASQINADIRKVVEWGLVNKVQFNVQKTQMTTLTRKSLLLGINISGNMSWHDHVVSIAKTASRKLGVLFRCRKLYTPEQLLLLYRAQIRPSLEYCSHVWSCAPKHSLKLLDSIQNRAVRLIDTPNLTRDLDSLEHRRRVAALSLFCRFYHGRCSRELSQIITPKAVRKKNTRETLTSLFQHSFFWRASTLWNELPGNLFPDGYNLQRFKTNLENANSSVVKPLEEFRKKHIGGAKSEKKKFEKQTAKFCQNQERYLNLTTKKPNSLQEDPTIPTVANRQKEAFSCLQSAVDSMEDPVSPSNLLEGPVL
nr:unnamed protein product [Callosobruchus analis]